MIPQTGQRFKVSFKAIKYTFDAVILRVTQDGMYELKTFNRLDFDCARQDLSKARRRDRSRGEVVRYRGDRESNYCN